MGKVKQPKPTKEKKPRKIKPPKEPKQKKGGKKEKRELYAIAGELDVDQGDEKNKKGGKLTKKKIILLLLLVAIASGAGAFLFLKEDENIIVEEYTASLLPEVAEGEESEEEVEPLFTETIPSLTAQVGERWMDELLTYEVDGTTKTEYVYQKTDTTEADLEQYETYLVEECGFASIDTSEKEAAEGILDLKEYAIAAQQEGYVFVIEIAQQEKQFSIITSVQEGEDPNAEEEEERKEFTRAQALTEFETFLEEANVLPEPIEHYDFIFDVGQSYINGIDCYGITIYEKGESNCNVFVDKYYISLEDQSLFLYDNVTRKSTPIQIEPNEQQSVQTESMPTEDQEGSITTGVPQEQSDSE